MTPSPVNITRLEKAATDNGFDLDLGRTLAQVRHESGDTGRKSKKSAHDVTKSALHSAFHSRCAGMVMSSWSRRRC